MPHTQHLRTLIDAASRTRRAVVVYGRCIPQSGSAITPSSRVIEPYSFFGNAGGPDTIIRCYQVEEGGDPSRAGWRFLVAHKLVAVQPTLTTFNPRLPVCIPKDPSPERAESESEARRAYRDCVWDLLATGEIEAGDLFHIESIKEQHAVTKEDMRAVHASVYYRCLGAAMVDGSVSDDEAEQLAFLHRAMRFLGWALGD